MKSQLFSFKAIAFFTAVSSLASQAADKTPGYRGTGWEKMGNVPFVRSENDIDGIEIPRIKQDPKAFKLNIPAASAPQARKRGERLVISIDVEPRSLLVLQDNSQGTVLVDSLYNDVLVEQDAEGHHVRPGLASKWYALDVIRLKNPVGQQSRKVFRGDVELKAGSKFEAKDFPIKLTTTGAPARSSEGTWVKFKVVSGKEGATSQTFSADPSGTIWIDSISLSQGTYEVSFGPEVVGKAESTEDVETVEQQASQIFELNPRAKWQDGNPVLATDVELTCSIMKNEHVITGSTGAAYSSLQYCWPLAENKVEVRFRSANPLNLAKASELGYHLLPLHYFAAQVKEKTGKDLVLNSQTGAARDFAGAMGKEIAEVFTKDRHFSEKPIGTGPYQVTKWDRGQSITLQHISNYWKDTRFGYFDSVVVKTISNSTTALLVLANGEIDAIDGVTPNSQRELEAMIRKDPKLKETLSISRGITPGYSYLLWNNKSFYFQDYRVRKAMTLLAPIEEYRKSSLPEHAFSVSGPLPFWTQNYDKSLAPVGGKDAVDTAQQLLADAGWLDTRNSGVLEKEGKPFQFTMHIRPHHPLSDFLLVYQKQLKDVGIQMNLEHTEWGTFIQKVRQKQGIDAAVLAVSFDTLEPAELKSIFHGSLADRPGVNYSRFSNEIADKLLDIVETSLDPKERRAAFISLHRVLDNLQPITFLYPTLTLIGHSSKVQPYFVPNSLGYDLREWHLK